MHGVQRPRRSPTSAVAKTAKWTSAQSTRRRQVTARQKTSPVLLRMRLPHLHCQPPVLDPRATKFVLINDSCRAVNAADLAERRSKGAGPLPSDEFNGSSASRMLTWPQAQLPGQSLRRSVGR